MGGPKRLGGCRGPLPASSGLLAASSEHVCGAVQMGLLDKGMRGAQGCYVLFHFGTRPTMCTKPHTLRLRSRNCVRVIMSELLGTQIQAKKGVRMRIC